MDLSLVIPLYNEDESLPELCKWIERIVNEHHLSYEIILIDDGSVDDSWKIVETLSEVNSKIKGIRFQRNYGKSAALNEGFKAASGEVIITMDADMQDSPDEIPELYRMIMEGGYDLVSGWKQKRRDPLSKTIPSRFFNWFTRQITHIPLHDFNCGLKSYRKKVIKSIEVYGEMHRYIPVIAKWAGFKKITEKPVIHYARKYGISKFGWERVVNGYLDLASIMFVGKYGKRPMHFFGFLGSIIILIGLGISTYLIVLKIMDPSKSLSNRPPFYLALTTMVIGVQLFVTGFVAELISRNSPGRNYYLIEKKSDLTNHSLKVQSVVILGPAHPFRGGGITTFNERLARAFQQLGYHSVIYGFSLQYPSFLFPGKTQYSTEPAPLDLTIYSKVNSVNPFNWIKVGNELKNLKPDLIVVRFWLPFMGAALGTILRIVKRNRHTRIVAITDNVIPHEKRAGDLTLTRYFLGACHSFITMSDHVMKDLRKLAPGKPAKQVLHPLYDTFGQPVSKTEAREKLNLRPDDKILLFFGFIRKYKGLDILLESMKILHDTSPPIPDLKLLIAGEFYEDEKIYQDKISQLGIRDMLILKTEYIEEAAVKNYFCAADVVIQPYRAATQSGVTPLAYHFEKPMIVTNVGALADYVPHEKAGLVAEPNPASIAIAILHYFELGEKYFISHLRNEKQHLSWGKLVESIVEVSEV